MTHRPQPRSRDIEIDGSYGEGGGQLLRTAVALAAITGNGVRIHNIRARRDKPGLAPQHLAAVRAVAQFCDAATEGLEVGSQALRFHPQHLHGGDYAIDIGTAGSITLVLQALLPVMIAAHAPAAVHITGGTDVRAAPPLDYFCNVLLAHLARMGAPAQVTVQRRGYYPRGGGRVEVRLRPQPRAPLRPLVLIEPGAVRRIDGVANVANLPRHVAQRMRSSVLAQLDPVLASRADIRISMLGHDEAIGQGGAVVAWAQTEHSVLGAGCVAERGVRAETLGARVGAELNADLVAGAALDVHAADQILLHLALSGAACRITTRQITLHARTAMWLIERFLPVRFRTEEAGQLYRLDCVPC